MLLKQMLVGAAFVVTAFGAQATTYNLGTLATGDNYLSGSETANVLVSKGSFSDIFNFSLSAKSDVTTDAGVLNFGKFFINGTTFSYSLFTGSTLLATGTDASGFTNLALGTGSYHLDVTGNATALKGLYNGTINVSPVPEAETYSMMLLGLGLMGFIARRRRAD